MKTSPTTAINLTLLAVCFWGSNFQATKFALTSVPPWTASVERFLIAVLGIFLILIVKEGIRWNVLSHNLVAYVVLGIIGVAGFNGSLFVGLQTSSPITASLIMATTPISANILEGILRRELPGRDRVIGMIVSLLGVSLVITNGQILFGQIHFAEGDIVILMGSIGWAAYTVGTRAFVRESTPLETTSWTMLFGMIALIIAATVFEDPFIAITATSNVSLLAALWMGIAGSVLAYLFWNVGIAVRGAGKTSIFFNLVPVFALLISILTGTVPQGAQIFGIILTIGGVLVGQGRFAGMFSRKTPAEQQ